jgi:hypothetical protein
MADLTTGQVVGTATGSGPASFGGVSDGSGGAAVALANTVSGFASIFGAEQRANATSALAQAKLDRENKGSIIGAQFIQDNIGLAQAKQDGALDTAQANTRFRASVSQYLANYPEHTKEITDAVKDFNSQGIGKILGEKTEQEQSFAAAKTKAIDDGFLWPGASDREAAAGVDRWMRWNEVTTVNQRLIQERTILNGQLTTEGKITSNEHATLNLKIAQRDEQFRTGLGELMTVAGDQLEAELKKGLTGGDNPKAALVSREDQIMHIKGTIAQAKQNALKFQGVSPESVTALNSAFDLIEQRYLMAADGKIELESLQTGNLIAVERAKRVAMSDTDILGTVAISQLGLSDHLSLFVKGKSKTYTGFLNKLSEKSAETELGLETAPAGAEQPNPKSGVIPVSTPPAGSDPAVKAVFATLADDSKNVNEGKLTTPDLDAQLTLSTVNLLKSIKMEGMTPDWGNKFTDAMTYLADPSVGTYFSRPELPETQAAAMAGLDQVMHSEGQKMSQMITDIAPGQYGIRAVWGNGGMRMEGGEHFFKLDDLNKRLRPLVNRYTKALAHQKGTKDYQMIWEEFVMPQLFEGQIRGDKQRAALEAAKASAGRELTVDEKVNIVESADFDWRLVGE